MDLGLDRKGDVPLGVQLAWALRSRIVAGELRRGERLPGVRELAAETGVNVNTVRTVYARLEADGLVVAEQGRGTFVSESARVDDRLAGIRRRALDDIRAAGLDPRELAAALWAGESAERAASSPPTGRAALRAEIGSLERALSDLRLVRALAAQREDPLAVSPRPSGGRILGEDELRAIRDDLVAQLEALRAEPSPAAEEPATEAAPQPAPRGRPARWTPSLGT